MNRVIAFVDGFNVYHQIAKHRKFKNYKWLNLWALIEKYLTGKDSLKEVYYFSAYANWIPDRVKRHKVYVRALELKGVTPVLGEFKIKDRFCFLCKKKYKTHEEKETDVNIAIKLFQTAYDDLYDKAIVVSGDSDLVPAIKGVRQSFPQKEISVLIPPNIYAESLKKISDRHMYIRDQQLRTSQLEDPIQERGITIHCPDEWK